MILVVGAAIIRHNTLLVARRTKPPEAARRWELPGGKVEAGGDPGDALVREIAEELGCRVRVETWLDGEQPIGSSYLLRAARCTLVEGDPRPGDDHDELRWLTPEVLDDVDWLEPDRPFLGRLREILMDAERLDRGR
jgi:8-oxo-dGTP diphosphatase